MRDKNKKAVPLLLVDAPPRRLCPVCGAVSYSREGIHPQCAERRADVPRMERVMADNKVDKRKGIAEDSSLVRPWHKRCPECQTQLHIRKMACVCGYRFDETT
jgi:rubredoxin